MTDDNLFVRSLHDVGLAAWFGGSLMGAVGLNGAANDVSDPTDRSRVAAAGWARWAPVNAAAVGVHLIGGAALTASNRARVVVHSGSRRNTVIKTLLTVAAMGATAYSGWLGKQVAEAGSTHVGGATIPSDRTPQDVAEAQERLRIAQWTVPALTGALVVLGAQQGEQQRPTKLARDLVHRTREQLTS